MNPVIPQPVGTPALLPALTPSAATVLMTIDAMPWHRRDRIARIGALTPEDTAAGLIWLALNYPATCDALLDKIEWDAADDEDPR